LLLPTTIDAPFSNEQDSAFFMESFAMIPVIEPSTQQEAYDAVRYGFEISEKIQFTRHDEGYHPHVALPFRNCLPFEGSSTKTQSIFHQTYAVYALPAFARKQYQNFIENSRRIGKRV
jgi:hypothetical protein